jgi:hypothetical protein
MASIEDVNDEAHPKCQVVQGSLQSTRSDWLRLGLHPAPPERASIVVIVPSFASIGFMLLMNTILLDRMFPGSPRL